MTVAEENPAVWSNSLTQDIERAVQCGPTLCPSSESNSITLRFPEDAQVLETPTMETMQASIGPELQAFIGAALLRERRV